MKMRILSSMVTACLSLAGTVHASVTLTLDPPSGTISGLAGNTIGWGFTLSNPADFAVISSSNFCLGDSGIGSLCISPTIGTYTDFIAGNFTIAGPSPESPVVTEVFDLMTSTGLGSLTINATADVGATNTGQLVATYDLYSLDPNALNFDSIADLISTGNFLTAPASVIVTTPTSSVPEPSYMGMIPALGVVWMGWRTLLRGGAS